MPELVSVIRVLSFTLIISGVRNIQQAYVSRNLLFRKLFYATIGGTACSAVIGIWMAFASYGIWALVVQNLFNAAVGTIILWYSVEWRPKMVFSFHRLKSLFSYGWKLLVSALINTGYNNFTSLVIGKLYSSADLAFFDRGRQFPNLIVNNINAAIDSVLLPTLSSQQDNRVKVRSMTRRAIKTSTYLMMPVMMGLAVCAEPLVRIVLTEKWLPCAFFLRIFCFTFAFYPIHTANLSAINALGRSDLFLKLEIIKKIVGLIALFATMNISVEAIALSMPITSILGQLINSWPNRQLLDYNYIEQVKDMLPQIGLSCVMGIIVYYVQFFHWNDWLTLSVQILTGALVYIVGSKLLHIDSFDYIIAIAKGYFERRGN